MKKVIYAGSFDPIHSGHIDIIKRTMKLFPSREIVIIVANNRNKKHYFNIEERIKIVKKALSKIKNIKIIKYEGIISEYAKENKAEVMIRGIRNGIDLDYEFNLEQFTRKTSKMETVYLTPKNKHINTSSSLIRMFIETKNKKKAKKYMNEKSYKKMSKFLKKK
jgi:pantetheine-phosphate adenylyltransferase